MNRWNTQEMVNLVKSLTGLNVEVQSNEPGEHFTDELSINIGDDMIILGGFIDGDLSDPSDEDVEYVYLYDGSGNGLRSRDKNVRNSYFLIKDALEDKGFEVVDNYEDYF